MSGLAAASWYTVEPPQHQPVTPTLPAATPGRVLAQSTAALRSPSVCSRFCASTILSTSWTLGVLRARARRVPTLRAEPVNAVPVARTSGRVSMLASSSGAQVAREELQALLPGGRGRRRLVRRAVVGVERVARVGINDHLHV